MLTGNTALDALERAALVGLIVWPQTHEPGERNERLYAAYVAAAIVTVVPFRGALAGLVGAAWAVAVLLTLTTWVGRRIAGALALGAVVLSLPAGLAALKASWATNRAQDSLNSASALGLAKQGDATNALKAAKAETSKAKSALNAIWVKPSRLVPVVGVQIGTAQRLVGSVDTLVGFTATEVEKIDPHKFGIVDGRLPVAAIAQAEPAARRIALAANDVLSAATAARKRWLVPPLERGAKDIQKRAKEAVHAADLAADAARVVPPMLGGKGDRTYFLLVQNPAEARASGGILASYAEVHVVDGRLQLGTVGRDSDLNTASEGKPIVTTEGFQVARQLQPDPFWQNMTMSPDFPSVGAQILAEYAAIGRKADGVISLDPAALAAMLEVSGPVNVTDWPEPITKDNVVRIFEHDQYVRFPQDADREDSNEIGRRRDAFLASAVSTIWNHVLQMPDFDAATVMEVLGQSAREGHLQLFSPVADEQTILTRSKAAGVFPRSRGDVLSVVTQNAAANKVDWFMHRTVEYRPRINLTTGAVKATVTITLRNDAPTSGLSTYVLGTGRNGPPGSERVSLQVYTPWELKSVKVDGNGSTAAAYREHGVNVLSTSAVVPAGGTTTVVFDLEGQWKWPGSRTYSLTLRRQALVHGDEISVRLPGDSTPLASNASSGETIVVYRLAPTRAGSG